MTLIGYALLGVDNSTYMFRGDAQPARCATCSIVLDHTWSDPAYALRAGRKHDVSYTYDGCLIVSDKFRAAVKSFPGASYVRLPSEPGWSVLHAARTLRFDAERRQTTFEDFCETCGRFTQVAGATPVFLSDPPAPLPEELMRTDIEFGSGDGLSPLVLIGLGVANVLRRHRLSGLELHPVETDSRAPTAH